MTVRIDPSEANWESKLDQLRPVEGVCIMVDMVESTQRKEKHFKEWVKVMAETFVLIKAHAQLGLLKSIGDMGMFWIKAEEFHRTLYAPWLLHTLATMHAQQSRHSTHFLPLRGAVCFCREVLEISFMVAVDDVYGKGIDLTSRLCGLAGKGEILMNEDFRNILIQHNEKLGVPEAFPSSQRLQGPWSHTIKGFERPQSIYKITTS